MQMPEDNHDSKALEAPPKLVSALRGAPKARIFIPLTMDEAILRAARRQLSNQKGRRFAWPFLFRWGIAVAAVVLLVAIVPQLMRKPGFTTGAALVRGDLNHDGRVDILDAFALARELKTRVHPSQQLDINGDGVVDEKDVTALAAQAVSLAKGRRL